VCTRTAWHSTYIIFSFANRKKGRKKREKKERKCSLTLSISLDSISLSISIQQPWLSLLEEEEEAALFTQSSSLASCFWLVSHSPRKLLTTAIPPNFPAAIILTIWFLLSIFFHVFRFSVLNLFFLTQDFEMLQVKVKNWAHGVEGETFAGITARFGAFLPKEEKNSYRLTAVFSNPLNGCSPSSSKVLTTLSLAYVSFILLLIELILSHYFQGNVLGVTRFCMMKLWGVCVLS